MSESESSVKKPEASKPYIWLECFDGSIQQVEQEFAMRCPMIERQIVKYGMGSSKNDAIDLPERVNPASLSLILAYCGRSRKGFRKKFVRLDTEKLIELASAADSLGLKPLVDLTSRARDRRALAQICEGKTPVEGIDWTGIRSVNIDAFAGLETWEDPTPRPSPFTFEDLRAAFVETSKRQMRHRPKPPSRGEQMIRWQEHNREILLMALHVYAEQNNMEPTELELVEIRERNLIDESGKGYVHFNFIVKSWNGTVNLLFAEVHPDCREEKDVYLCTALKENDSGHCIGCKDRAKGLMHPSDGGYLGGHKNVRFPFMVCYDSDDDE